MSEVMETLRALRMALPERYRDGGNQVKREAVEGYEFAEKNMTIAVMHMIDNLAEGDVAFAAWWAGYVSHLMTVVSMDEDDMTRAYTERYNAVMHDGMRL